MSPPWEVIIRPDAKDRGVIVGLWDGATFSTEGRVAWARIGRGSSFKRKLREVIARAQAEASRLNA